MPMRMYLLKYNKKLILPLLNTRKGVSIQDITTFLANIESLGFTFSLDILERLYYVSKNDFIKLYLTTIDTFKEMVGNNVAYEPMYPNFPHEVMRINESQLYMNAMLHYVGDSMHVRITPNIKKKNRPGLKELIDLEVIQLGYEEELHSLFRNFMQSTIALSQDQKEAVVQYLQTYQVVPDTIPVKENATFICATLLKYSDSNDVLQIVRRLIKNVTDVLRLVVALCNGDVSLATNTRFEKIHRKQRKLILELIESCPNVHEDMFRHKAQWIRLGERLHPFEYKDKFPLTAQAFKLLRENKKPVSFNSKIEKYLEEKNIFKAIELLKTRPSLLVRRLDQLLRLSDLPTSDLVIETFQKVAPEVPTTILLHVHHYFSTLSRKADRIFFPKGNVAKAFIKTNNLPELYFVYKYKIVQICETTLITRFSRLDKWNSVYVDEELKNYIVPFAQRSASESLSYLIRGTRIPLEHKNVVRFFIHWHDMYSQAEYVRNEYNGYNRVDVDLTALLLDANYQFIDHIGYTHLKSKNLGVHSGDITSAPNGASEFIDIDLSKVKNLKQRKESILDPLKKEYPEPEYREPRYLVMIVQCFTNQPFKDIPECFAGWMMRKKPNSGEIYEPLTVKNKSELQSDTRIMIPLIIDVIDRVVIWCDLALRAHPSYRNNVHGNLSSLSLMAKAMVELEKPNLYNLFMMHAKGRAFKLVDKDHKKEADVLITKESFSNDEIMATFMA